jgi:hypothetical protein
MQTAPAIATVKARPRTWNKVLVNLILDICLFVAFIWTMAPQLGGIAVHEWLSIAFAAAIIGHLLLHWQWIVNTVRRFFGRMSATQRINFVLNTLLFVDFTIIMFTGFMIGEAALPMFGIRPGPGFQWRRLHDVTSNLALLLLGMHIALHWQWILSSVSRFLLKPFKRAPKMPAGTHEA